MAFRINSYFYIILISLVPSFVHASSRIDPYCEVDGFMDVFELSKNSFDVVSAEVIATKVNVFKCNVEFVLSDSLKNCRESFKTRALRYYEFHKDENGFPKNFNELIYRDRVGIINVSYKVENNKYLLLSNHIIEMKRQEALSNQSCNLSNMDDDSFRKNMGKVLNRINVSE